jgi:hypothetical protein
MHKAGPHGVKVLPGLEPGLQGSKPWVLTNYTIEPGRARLCSTSNHGQNAVDTDEI